MDQYYLFHKENPLDINIDRTCNDRWTELRSNRIVQSLGDSKANDNQIDCLPTRGGRRQLNLRREAQCHQTPEF